MSDRSRGVHGIPAGGPGRGATSGLGAGSAHPVLCRRSCSGAQSVLHWPHSSVCATSEESNQALRVLIGALGNRSGAPDLLETITTSTGTVWPIAGGCQDLEAASAPPGVEHREAKIDVRSLWNLREVPSAHNRDPRGHLSQVRGQARGVQVHPVRPHRTHARPGSPLPQVQRSASRDGGLPEMRASPGVERDELPPVWHTAAEDGRSPGILHPGLRGELGCRICTVDRAWRLEMGPDVGGAALWGCSPHLYHHPPRPAPRRSQGRETVRHFTPPQGKIRLQNPRKPANSEHDVHCRAPSPPPCDVCLTENGCFTIVPLTLVRQ